MEVFYGKASLATYLLLEKLGIEVVLQKNASCCGQIQANRGCRDDAEKIVKKFADDFSNMDVDYVVSPSGSCVSMIRETYPYYLGKGNDDYLKLKNKTFELCEFLLDVLKIEKLPYDASAPKEVSVHYNCHALRHLHLSQRSEQVLKERREGKVERLLNLVSDIKILPLDNPDECCGFGGTFSVKEAAVSNVMGLSKLKQHQDSKSKCIVSADVSCFMHLAGLSSRNKLGFEFYHVAEILTWGMGK